MAIRRRVPFCRAVRVIDIDGIPFCKVFDKQSFCRFQRLAVGRDLLFIPKAVALTGIQEAGCRADIQSGCLHGAVVDPAAGENTARDVGFVSVEGEHTVLELSLLRVQQV